MTKDNKESVVMYRNQVEALLACSPKDCRLILAAIRDYGMNGEPVEMPEHLQPLWIMFKFSIDETHRKYTEMCEKRSKAALAGNQQMRANASKRSQTQANASKRSQTQANAAYTDNDTDNDNDISLPIGSDIKNARAREKAPKVLDYPQSEDDVLALAQALKLDMTTEQARKYYLYRSQREWTVGTGSGAFKLKPENVPQNMQLWVDADKAEEARTERERLENYDGIIGGDYIPKH